MACLSPSGPPGRLRVNGAPQAPPAQWMRNTVGGADPATGLPNHASVIAAGCQARSCRCHAITVRTAELPELRPQAVIVIDDRHRTERRVWCLRPPRPACLQPPRRRRRCRGPGPPGRPGRGDRRRDGRSGQGPAHSRLLLGRGRLQARHQPPGRTAALGRILIRPQSGAWSSWPR